MGPLRRFLQVVCILLIFLAIGVIGYTLIEDMSYLDAVYMTVITLSTVGYKEVQEISTGGRIFTILLIIGGVGLVFYTLTTIVQFIIEGNLKRVLWSRRMKENISDLRGHILVCGYGRVGREVARVFEQESKPFVVIDNDPNAVAKIRDDGYLHIEGDATHDEVLEESGIERARGLVAATGSDVNNLFIVLSARALVPDLFITARACGEESELKLKLAGADRTIYPHVLGGRRLAMMAIRPLVIDFVDTALGIGGRELMLENIEVGSGSPADGKSIREGQQGSGGAIILAVKKKGGKLLTRLTDDIMLASGDELVVIGTREQLRALEGSA